MRKNSAPVIILTWIMAIQAWIPAMADTTNDYCGTDLGKANNSSRYTKGLTVSDNSGTELTIDDCQERVMDEIYWDRTDRVFITSPGCVVTFKPLIGRLGEWQMAYFYMDRNRDGEFSYGIEENGAPTADSEIIAYNYYRATSSDAYRNSNGEAATQFWSQNSSAPYLDLGIPTFIVPDDIEEGDYRVRFKNDWNSLDPCGNIDPKNHISANGGMIMDFTLRVVRLATRTITIAPNDPSLGTVAFVDPATAGSSLTAPGDITVRATVTDPYAYFTGWTDGTGKLLTNRTEYTYDRLSSDDIDLTANFRQHYPVEIIDTKGTTTIKSPYGDHRSGDLIDRGTEVTVICRADGLKLSSLLVNDKEVVDSYDGSYTFTMEGPTRIEANYTVPVWHLSVAAGPGGKVVCSSETADNKPAGEIYSDGDELADGLTFYITVTPDEGYLIESLIVDGDVYAGAGAGENEDFVIDETTHAGVLFYYAFDDVNVSATFAADGSSIDSIVSDSEGSSETIYNIHGMRVSGNLAPGVYVMRRGGSSEKIVVR